VGGELIVMQGRSSSRVAFDSLMAGGSAQELRAKIKEMPAGERRNFLCTSCCMYDRVQSISPKRARVLDEVLASGCSFYRAGAEVCTLNILVVLSALPQPAAA